MYAQKLSKKARKAALDPIAAAPVISGPDSETEVAGELFRLAQLCESRGWSAESLLRAEARKRERNWRRAEAARPGPP